MNKIVCCHLVILILMLGMATYLSGQTPLISPTGDGGFETGTTFSDNGWTVVNGTYQNQYYVGTAPVQYAGSRCAFISNSSTTWASNTAERYRHIYRPVIFPAGATNITLTFFYKMNSLDTDSDGFKIFLTETTVTPGTGGYPTGTQLGVAWYNSVTSWTQVTISIAASNAGTTKRLVFSWHQDGSANYAVGALDNIGLTYVPPPDNPTTFAAAAASSSQINLSWNKNAANNDVMVVWNSTNTFGTPVNGTSYSVGNTITGGGTVIYNGSGTSYSHTSLTPETTYYYRAWSVSGTTQYSTGVNANATTLSNKVTVTIGSGTATNDNFPVTGNSNYSYTQQIYTKAQINQAGTIEKIRFFKNDSDAMTNSNVWRILMGHTSKTSFTSTSDWVSIFAMTQVFEGFVTVTAAAGWKEITLQTPFYYDNATNHNLVIAVEEEQSSSGNAISWLSFTSGTNTGIQVNGTTDYMLYSPPVGTRNADRNQIQLVFSYLTHPTMYCVVPQGQANHLEHIEINNIGSSPMQVTAITDDASWLTYTASLPQTIAPGGTWSVPVTLDATTLTGSVTVPEYTIYTATISITTSLGVLTKPVSLKVISSQPPTNPKHIAQWEPARGALIRYPLGIPDDLVLDLFNQGDSLYCVVSSGNYSAAYTYLQNTVGIGAANMSRVNWIIAANDSYWSRDWGPITIYEDDGLGGRRFAMVDFDYNRDNRPNDDLLIPAIGADLGIPYYFIPMSLTGGNILTDGQNIEYADEWVILQNDGDTNTGQDGTTVFTEKYAYTPHQFEELVSLYRGDLWEQGFRSFQDPQTTYIHHIDCWAKLLSVDRVLIADGGTNNAALDAIAAYWGTLTASNGNPYQVFRVNCPNNEPYTNSYILNGKVFMPYWGSSGGGAGSITANDTAAIAAYNTALSGLTFGDAKAPYSVEGYLTDGPDWVGTDAIHCRVHTIFLTEDEPPLPVELSSFTVVTSVTNQAMLTWVTQTETNVAGFNIYRGTSNELTEAVQLNAFIEATNTSQQQTYIYVDEEIWQSGTYYYWLESRDLDGTNNFYGPVSITLQPNAQQTPPVTLVTGIDGVFPNPFNPSTTIAYTVSETSEVEILIYNVKGQLVRQLLSQTKQPGNHRELWNGKDNNGSFCASGLYNVVLCAGNKTFNRKAVLLK